MLGVEESEVGVQAWEEACFNCTEQQTANDQAAIALYQAGESGNDTPGNDNEGDVVARSELLQDQVGGDLEENVCDEKDGDADLELVAD